MWDHPDIVALRRKVAEIEAEWASARQGETKEVRERHRLALNAIRDRMAELKAEPRQRVT
jgi:hypothetical protein